MEAYMEEHMELTKKTTILLSPESHRRLTDLASRRGVSLGVLVREACATVYGIGDDVARTTAATALASLHLPVGTVAAMKRESVPDADTLLPG
jgi:predicted DNA-binding protein